MLENIRSRYILRKIFCKMNDKRKLKIVIYNKRIQKKLNLTILNFKLISGKYIEGEKNGIGNEYDIYTDLLIFEGEYKNGKKIGKGKEYGKFGDLIFEGEYLNGKRNGRGKEYKKGSVIFQGEYKDWKRNGIGKEYKFDSLFSEGEYLDGKKWKKYMIVILIIYVK